LIARRRALEKKLVRCLPRLARPHMRRLRRW
jgi:hypothetical protein